MADKSKDKLYLVKYNPDTQELARSIELISETGYVLVDLVDMQVYLNHSLESKQKVLKAIKATLEEFMEVGDEGLVITEFRNRLGIELTSFVERLKEQERRVIGEWLEKLGYSCPHTGYVYNQMNELIKALKRGELPEGIKIKGGTK